MVGQMDSKNSKVTFVIKIIFLRTFVIITSLCNVIRDNTKLEGQDTGIGQSSPGSLYTIAIANLLLIVGGVLDPRALARLPITGTARLQREPVGN